MFLSSILTQKRHYNLRLNFAIYSWRIATSSGFTLNRTISYIISFYSCQKLAMLLFLIFCDAIVGKFSGEVHVRSMSGLNWLKLQQQYM